jgi:predicted porin
MKHHNNNKRSTSSGSLLKKAAPCLLALCGQTLTLTPAVAAVSDAEVEELRAMIAKLQKKIDEIEASQHEVAQTVAANAAASSRSEASTKSGNLLPEGVTLYGALDSGIERVTNVGPNEKTLDRVPSTTGRAPNMVGLDFRHNVNDSIAAVGKAEMGIYLDSGDSGQGGRIFGRQAYIGLDSPIGSVTFGRQYSMLLFGLIGGEVLGPNIQGLGSIDAYIPNARHDNAVVWRAKFDQLSLGAHYSFGRETADGSVPGSGTCGGEDVTDVSRCRSWSAMAKYNDPRFGLAVAIDNQYGGDGAQAVFYNGSAPIPMTSASDEDSRFTANGYLRLGGLKLAAGWLRREVSTKVRDVNQDTTWLQGVYSLTPKVLLDGGMFHVDNTDKGTDEDRSANLYVLRGTYRIDTQLSTYLSLAFMDNDSNSAYGVSAGGAGAAPVAGNSQFGTMLGVRYTF